MYHLHCVGLNILMESHILNFILSWSAHLQWYVKFSSAMLFCYNLLNSLIIPLRVAQQQVCMLAKYSLCW